MIVYCPCYILWTSGCPVNVWRDKTANQRAANYRLEQWHTKPYEKTRVLTGPAICLAQPVKSRTPITASVVWIIVFQTYWVYIPNKQTISIHKIDNNICTIFSRMWLWIVINKLMITQGSYNNSSKVKIKLVIRGNEYD